LADFDLRLHQSEIVILYSQPRPSFDLLTILIDFFIFRIRRINTLK